MWPVFSSGNLYRVYMLPSLETGKYLEMVYWCYIVTHDKIILIICISVLYEHNVESSLCSHCSEISWWWAWHRLFFIHAGHSLSSFNYRDLNNSFLGNSLILLLCWFLPFHFLYLLFLELLLFICWDSWIDFLIFSLLWSIFVV